MYIGHWEILSEEFIRNNKDKVDWNWISSNRELSENFIREFQDRIDWYWISKYQKLSIKFIIEFKNKINWASLLCKYGYIVYYNNYEIVNHYVNNNIDSDRYNIESDNGNYHSDYLNTQEFINLAVKLISLKAFQ